MAAKKKVKRKSPGAPVTPAGTKARALCEKFPLAGTKTLARMLKRDHPKTYKDVEHARSYVRRIRGATGAQALDRLADKSLVREPGKPGNPFGAIPEPWVEMPDWSVHQYNQPGVWGILQDIHAPFHNMEALNLALDHLEELDPVGIILNGDIADCHAVGWWVKDPDKRDFAKERTIVRQLLEHIRARFPDAIIVYKEGNHEERMESYLVARAPELFGVQDFRLKSLYGLDDLDIAWVGDKQPIRLGKLNVIHGHEYKFAISNPVNPARGLFLRGGVNAICGHFHQTSAHSAKNLEQHLVSAWSGGCLCDLHPKWLPLNNWGHGFMVVEIDEKGAFEVQNHRIIHGKVY
jgi:hypothetical protein